MSHGNRSLRLNSLIAFLSVLLALLFMPLLLLHTWQLRDSEFPLAPPIISILLCLFGSLLIQNKINRASRKYLLELFLAGSLSIALVAWSKFFGYFSVGHTKILLGLLLVSWVFSFLIRYFLSIESLPERPRQSSVIKLVLFIIVLAAMPFFDSLTITNDEAKLRVLSYKFSRSSKEITKTLKPGDRPFFIVNQDIAKIKSITLTPAGNAAEGLVTVNAERSHPNMAALVNHVTQHANSRAEKALALYQYAREGNSRFHIPIDYDAVRDPMLFHNSISAGTCYSWARFLGKLGAAAGFPARRVIFDPPRKNYRSRQGEHEATELQWNNQWHFFDSDVGFFGLPLAHGFPPPLAKLTANDILHANAGYFVDIEAKRGGNRDTLSSQIGLYLRRYYVVYTPIHYTNSLNDYTIAMRHGESFSFFPGQAPHPMEYFRKASQVLMPAEWRSPDLMAGSSSVAIAGGAAWQRSIHLPYIINKIVFNREDGGSSDSRLQYRLGEENWKDFTLTSSGQFSMDFGGRTHPDRALHVRFLAANNQRTPKISLKIICQVSRRIIPTWLEMGNNRVTWTGKGEVKAKIVLDKMWNPIKPGEPRIEKVSLKWAVNPGFWQESRSLLTLSWPVIQGAMGYEILISGGKDHRFAPYSHYYRKTRQTEFQLWLKNLAPLFQNGGQPHVWIRPIYENFRYGNWSDLAMPPIPTGKRYMPEEGLAIKNVYE